MIGAFLFAATDHSFVTFSRQRPVTSQMENLRVGPNRPFSQVTKRKQHTNSTHSFSLHYFFPIEENKKTKLNQYKCGAPRTTAIDTYTSNEINTAFTSMKKKNVATPSCQTRLAKTTEFISLSICCCWCWRCCFE